MTTNRSTAIGSLITNTRSIIGRNRFTPVFILLIVILTSLGAIYYFKAEKEKARFVRYRFQNLATLATKWEQIMANFEERVKLGFVDTLKQYTKGPLQFERDTVIKNTVMKDTTFYFELPEGESVSFLNWRMAFDRFALYRKDSSLGDTLVYHTFPYTRNLNDALLKALDSTGMARISLQNQIYQLYTYPVVTRFSGQTTTWYLCGLVAEDTFRSEVIQLDIWILLILIGILLLIIMGFPLIKLIFVNEIERLNRKDIILAGISVVLGAPLVIVLFLSAFYYSDQYYDKIDNKLCLLSKSVERRMKEEFGNVVMALNSWQSGIPESYDAFKVLSKIDSAGVIQENPEFIMTLDSAKKDKQVKKGTNLNKRSYMVQARIDRQYWKAKEDMGYIMRPVLSLEENQEEAVFVVKAGSGYKVGSTKLGSLHDPILPPGYSFMVVDETGMVWFHSAPGRSTLENLFDEIEDNHLLKASLTGNIEARHFINYHGKNQLIRINPVEDTSLYVITMYDIEYLRLKISEILSLAGLGILLAFFITGLVTVVTVIPLRPANFYRDRSFYFYFLTPRKEHHLHYLLISIGFLTLMTLAIISFYFLGERMKPFEVFICNALLMMWGYIIVYISLADRERVFTFPKVFMIVVILLFNFFVGATTKILLFQAVILVVMFGLWYVRNRYFSNGQTEKLLSFLNLRNSYIVFLFVWLILTAIFPAFNYFIKARQIENIIWTKHEQLQMVRQLETKTYKIREELKYTDSSLYVDKVVKSVYFLHSNSDPATFQKVQKDSVVDKKGFRGLLWNYRPVYNELIAETQPLVYLRADNARWSWVEHGDSLLFEYKTTLPGYYRQDHYRGDAIYLTSILPEIDLSRTTVSGILVYLALLAGILGGFYWLIRFFVYRIFGINILEELSQNIQANRAGMTTFLNKELAFKKDFNLFIVGTPYSGKREMSAELAAKFNSKITLSLLNLDKVTISENGQPTNLVRTLAGEKSRSGIEEDQILANHELFVLEYFEYGYQSLKLNDLKLQLIKTLQDHRKAIIILSDIYPGQVLNFYQRELRKIPEGDPSSEHSFTSWRSVFGPFIEVVKTIKYDPDSISQCLRDKKNGKELTENEKNMITSELAYGNLLPSLSRSLVESSDLKSGASQLIANTNSMAYGYYHSIWNSLASREKYMVYDLAKDGFLNLKNAGALHSLMRKGIVRFEDQAVLFNKSFKNHVTHSTDKAEALEMEMNIQKQGTWSVVRAILYLIIAGIGGFLLFAEPNFVEDFGTFLTILAGLATIMPVASNLLGGKADG